ncbi:MAG: VTT domain-containing protein [Oligosphaeraceae bacterium]|nr:VTT domain-containing protein [Oligosphaeraceae bacterium]
MNEKKTLLPRRILLLAWTAALLFLLTFILWGESLERLLAAESFAGRMQTMQAWGWLLGMLALVADIALPVPATGIMAALGQVYGFWTGWLLGGAGSLLAGLTGYGLAVCARGHCPTWLCSPAELEEFRHSFERWGALAIIASRALPILPEVMVVLAGLAQMRIAVFLPALLAGTLPVSALYAWWGSHYGQEAPLANFLVAVLLPLLLWAIAMPFWRTTRRADTAAHKAASDA